MVNSEPEADTRPLKDSGSRFTAQDSRYTGSPAFAEAASGRQFTVYGSRTTIYRLTIHSLRFTVYDN